MHGSGVWRYDPTEEFGSYISMPFANRDILTIRWGRIFISDASPGQNYWATPISGKVQYPAKHASASFNDSVNNFATASTAGSRCLPDVLSKTNPAPAGSEMVYSRYLEEMQGDFPVDQCHW
ncbi:MAG: hypothetical protein R3C20_17845 [Planctomycetaceae bacterium]